MVPFFRRPTRLVGPLGGLVLMRKEFLRRGDFFIFFIVNIVI